MSVVAVGLRPSLHAAIKADKDLPVSVQSVYDKVKHTEPGIVRALVQGSATHLATIVLPMQQGQAPTVHGYRLRIVDGNHLPASEKRIKPLRTVREHGSSPKPCERDALCRAGRITTGKVYEQPVSIDDDGHELILRRVELHLNSPTEDGETVIHILSNLPKSAFTARKIARLYRRRWNIETLFQRLESVLCSEVTSLGNPRAALLAFGVAVLAYNALAVLESTVRATHNLQASEIELSSYYLAAEVKAHYAGMMVAVAMAAWDAYDALATPQLVATLLQVAEKVDLRAMRKHPRGPKKQKKKGYVDGAIARRHVATARILKGELVD